MKRAAKKRLEFETGIKIQESDLLYIEKLFYKSEYDKIWGENEGINS